MQRVQITRITDEKLAPIKPHNSSGATSPDGTEIPHFDPPTNAKGAPLSSRELPRITRPNGAGPGSDTAGPPRRPTPKTAPRRRRKQVRIPLGLGLGRRG